MCACFKSGFAEASVVNSIYPAKPNDDIVKPNLDKVTMIGISKPQKLVSICSLLESNVKNHLARKKFNYAIIGAKALDALATTCHNDLNMFISNISNVIKMLLDYNVEPQQPALKVKAFETLGITLQSLKHKNNFGQFADKIVECTFYSKSQDATANLRVRIAAMRVITRMLNDHAILENFPIAKIIPEILNNMTEQDVGAEFELGPMVSLNDKNLTVSPNHACKAADESLAYIANAISTSKADRIMHPIIEYLDKKKAWTTFATRVMNILLTNSQFAQYGYTVASFLITHVDLTADAEQRVQIMQLVKHVLTKQSNKAVISPLAIEQNYALLRQLTSYSDNASLKKLTDCILECISLVAKRSANTPQNTNLINGTLLVINKSRQLGDVSDASMSSLLQALINICSYAAAVPVGKHYPDSIIKNMSEYAVSLKPKHRELILQAFQGLVKSPQLENDKELQQGADNKIGAQIADNKNVTASLSVKQREEIHVTLFKVAMLQENLSSTFAEMLATIIVMLKQYKNKEIESGVPLMFSLLDTLLTAVSSVASGSSAASASSSSSITQDSQSTTLQQYDWKHQVHIHTLTVCYFYYLSQIHNYKDLSQYLEEIIAQRIKLQYAHKLFCEVLKKVAQISAADLSQKSLMDELEQLFTFPITATSSSTASNSWSVNNNNQLLIQKERVIEHLCNIESLKQSYPNLNEVLSKKFPTDQYYMMYASAVDSNQQQNQAELEDNVFDNDEEGSIADTQTNADKKNVDDDEWKRVNAANVMTHDYMIIGGTIATRQLNAKKDLLDFLSSLDEKKSAKKKKFANKKNSKRRVNNNNSGVTNAAAANMSNATPNEENVEIAITPAEDSAQQQVQSQQGKQQVDNDENTDIGSDIEDAGADEDGLDTNDADAAMLGSSLVAKTPRKKMQSMAEESTFSAYGTLGFNVPRVYVFDGI